MRETSFIKQNKEKWKEFEKILSHKDKDPDKLNDLFVQITDDLSYSRTFYPNRSVRVYLNNLAQQIFYSIYKSKKSRLGKLFSFWTNELPQLVYESRKEFRLAFILFIGAMAIGAFSSAMDPEFPRAILGDSYVDMTIENIESGDPMAVYKEKGSFGMSMGITANNLFVAFLTFLLGALFGIGSIAIMISNGIMVGAFQYFFYEQGLFKESFLTIWTHGTLEISAIIIAGAAGLTMGRGLVFPGTLSRLQSFQISARRGLKIMIGIAPVIIMAGFIEGYLTRYTGTPDLVRGLFILICLAFILFYYVWYPRNLAKTGFTQKINDTKLPPDNLQKIDFERIKTSGEIFADIFLFYKKNIRGIGTAIFAGVALFCVSTFLLANGEPTEIFNYPQGIFSMVGEINQFFVNDYAPLMPLFNIIIYSLITLVTFVLLGRAAKDYITNGVKNQNTTFYVVSFCKIAFIIGLIQGAFMLNDWYVPICFIFVGPLFFLWAFISYFENIDIIAAFGRMTKLISNNYGRVLGLFFLLSVIGTLFYSIMDTALIWFYFDFIGWNFSLDQETMNQFVAVLVTFTAMFIQCLIYPMILIGISFLYFTLVEIKDAPAIKEKIKYIGIGKRIQGLEKES